MADKQDYPFGFRISTFEVTGRRVRDRKDRPPRHLEGQVTVPVDLGSDAAMNGLLEALDVLRDGEPDQRDNQFHEVREVRSVPEARYVLCTVRGGGSGDELDIIAGTGVTTGKVTRQDSLVWTSRVLFAFAGNDARRGFMVQETKGTRSHGSRLVRRLNSELQRLGDMYLTVTNDRADAEVWKAVLRDEQSYIERIEFSSTAVDPSDLGEDARLKRMRVIYEFGRGGSFMHRVQRFLAPDQDRSAIDGLANEIGGVPLPMDEEGSHATAMMRTADGRRTIRVGEPSAPFVRVIESDSQLGDVEFLQAVSPDVVGLAGHLRIQLPKPFLPTDSLATSPTP